MKIKVIENYLKGHGPEFFQMAHILIPDNLQARQLVLDSIMNFLLEKRDDLKERVEMVSDEDHGVFLFSLKKRVMKKIVELAGKRFDQVKESLDSHDIDGEFYHFYQCSIDEKIVLFLKYKLNWDWSELGEILNMSKIDVISLVNSAKSKLPVGSNQFQDENEKFYVHQV